MFAPLLHNAAVLAAGLDLLDEDRQRGDLARPESVPFGDGAYIDFDARGFGVGIHVGPHHRGSGASQRIRQERGFSEDRSCALVERL